jgi:hypothetical protein
MKFAWRSTPNSPLSSPGADLDRLPGQGWIASTPGRMSIRSQLKPTRPVATALAVLRLALDSGGRIAIDPDPARLVIRTAPGGLGGASR